eukprot:SAG31_NODE_218_length_19934_cov_81.634837_2_plen_71_part_00
MHTDTHGSDSQLDDLELDEGSRVRHSVVKMQEDRDGLPKLLVVQLLIINTLTSLPAFYRNRYLHPHVLQL